MIGYSQSERWSTLDIIYFSTITLTTVGYGDIAPKTTGGKLTTIILIYSGILLVGSLLADIFETIFDAHEGVFLEELKEIRREAPPIDDESDAAERMRGLHGLVAEKGKKEVRRGLVSILVLFLAIYLLVFLFPVFRRDDDDDGDDGDDDNGDDGDPPYLLEQGLGHQAPREADVEEKRRRRLTQHVCPP
eukprot:CAMPEP_0167793000 /NCGR_PEP_ID=MMETSP0111_2-20121227/12899_1 /TAXON_ID=91324 /ORGANISM="Lotharella globosa, Strain CCCM811" /LENGTH=189 /DNA_ID=CAMNT_0007686033 /DNA_START=124 /DNA_END=694 /DNA_ORIENTATION=-